MADVSGAECRTRGDLLGRLEGCVKVEDVKVKCELAECVVCAGRSAECVDARAARSGAGSTLADVLGRHAPRDLLAAGPPLLCRPCRALLDALDQAELEFLKQKESFEAIIGRNPLYGNRTNITNTSIKVEFESEPYLAPIREESEDDVPLAVTKEKRKKKVYTRKKKGPTASRTQTKKKSKVKDKISLEILQNSTREQLESNPHSDVKTEDSIDGSEASSKQINGLHSELKLEVDDFGNGDDDDSDFFPEDMHDELPEDMYPENRPRKRNSKPRPKVMYECDQCDAKYTSCKRFELHKEKHSEGKPPFICEVCGASYKHKRACDIHIALHRGISDWKCEECNKLFPSKGALQRHNNIHTGKLNYQCDLCGKSFIHTSSFKMHKLSHSGLKPHSCDVCGLALMTRSHLKRHKRVHSGEKRHACAVCGKRFSERYNLLAHAKSHESAGEPAVPPAPRRRLFRCPYCQERYERRYMLERHVAQSHGRTLERVPATPRNTMSKLLKAQAQARALSLPQPAPAPAPPSGPAAPSAPPPPPSHTPASDVTDSKEERSPESRITILTHKLQQASSTLAAASWSGAYAAEFGIRTDFPH